MYIESHKNATKSPTQTKNSSGQHYDEIKSSISLRQSRTIKSVPCLFLRPQRNRITYPLARKNSSTPRDQYKWKKEKKKKTSPSHTLCTGIYIRGDSPRNLRTIRTTGCRLVLWFDWFVEEPQARARARTSEWPALVMRACSRYGERVRKRERAREREREREN